MTESTTARVLAPKDGKAGRLGSIGVRFMIDGADPDALAARAARYGLEIDLESILRLPRNTVCTSESRLSS